MLRWTIEVIIAWIFLLGLFLAFLPNVDSVYFLPYLLCCAFGGIIGIGGTAAQFLELKRKRN